jgi:hypothetical protein
MPRNFSDIVDASDRMDLIIMRVFHFIATASGMLREPQAVKETIFDDDGIQMANAPVLDEIYAWQSASEYILIHSRTPAGDHNFIRATMMRILSVMLSTVVRSAFFDMHKPELHDVFLPEYCEIVALCSSAVSHRGFLRSFVFDDGIMPSLFVVIIKCRDRMLRQEAVRVLKESIPRREGVWDSVIVAKIGERLLELEEDTVRPKLLRLKTFREQGPYLLLLETTFTH